MNSDIDDMVIAIDNIKIDKTSVQDTSEMKVWNHLITDGITNTMSGLSQMLGRNIIIESIKTGYIPFDRMPDMLGGNETKAVGIYLGFSGETNGHIMITYEMKLAYMMLEMITGRNFDASKSLAEMEQSALGDMGTIMGMSLVNAMADTIEVLLQPSPPAVLIDTPGAILGIAKAEILQGLDNMFVVETTLRVNDKTFQETFVIMLDHSFSQLPLNLSVRAS